MESLRMASGAIRSSNSEVRILLPYLNSSVTFKFAQTIRAHRLIRDSALKPRHSGSGPPINGLQIVCCII